MIEPLYGYLCFNGDVANDMLDKLLQYNLFNSDADAPVKIKEDYNNNVDYIFINYKETKHFHISEFAPDDNAEFSAILHFDVYDACCIAEHNIWIEIIKSDYVIQCDNYYNCSTIGNINNEGNVWTYCLPPDLLPWLKGRILKTNDVINFGNK